MYSYKNKKPLDYYNELEKKEIEIYEETFFCDNDVSDLKELDMKNILSRKVSKFEDFDYNLPQNIFLLKTYKGKIIVGRKIRSVLRIENKINAINCSMITSPMLLGFLKSRTYSNRKISIEFYPFTCEEKKYIFNDIKDNRLLDIYYPYKYKDYYSQKEEQSPETGWSFNPEKKEYLGYGEVYTAPEKYSMNGIIHFNVDTLFRSDVYKDIWVEVKDGKIISSRCNLDDQFKQILDSDEGSRYFGEFAFGLNPFIKKNYNDNLFNEKMLKTVHFAIGEPHYNTDNGNKSIMHWDLIVNMENGGEIYFDGKLVQKNGIFTDERLLGLNGTSDNNYQKRLSRNK